MRTLHQSKIIPNTKKIAEIHQKRIFFLDNMKGFMGLVWLNTHNEMWHRPNESPYKSCLMHQEERWEDEQRLARDEKRMEQIEKDAYLESRSGELSESDFKSPGMPESGFRSLWRQNDFEFNSMNQFVGTNIFLSDLGYKPGKRLTFLSYSSWVHLLLSSIAVPTRSHIPPEISDPTQLLNQEIAN